MSSFLPLNWQLRFLNLPDIHNAQPLGISDREPSLHLFQVTFGFFIKVQPPGPLLIRDSVSFGVFGICLHTIHEIGFVKLPTGLTQASANMMLTKKGEQNVASRSFDCISRMKRSLSIQLRNGCVHVNQRDSKWDTKSLSSVTVVHGKAGTRKSTISET